MGRVVAEIELIDTPEQWRTVRAARLLALRHSPEAAGSPLRRAERMCENDWRAEVSRRAWFVAADPDILGLVAGAWSSTREAEALLEAMWVSRHARRRGIGGALVDALTAWAIERSARTVALKVTTNNTDAINLYRGRGFEVTGEHGPLQRDPRQQYVVLRSHLYAF